MSEKLQTLTSKLLTIFYTFGFLLVSTELFLHLKGSSLCSTEGCRVVESFVRGGDVVLLIAGAIIFGGLLTISLIRFPYRWFLHSAILISAMAVEGYLVGFQLFTVHEVCVFCLTVFSLLALATLVRLIQIKGGEMIFAPVVFFAVLGISYFVTSGITQLSPNANYVLIYSKDCPHCKEVMQFCRTHSISVGAIESKQVAGILKALNIDSVPALFCNEGSIKQIVVGEDKIKQYLQARVTTEKIKEIISKSSKKHTEKQVKSLNTTAAKSEPVKSKNHDTVTDLQKQKEAVFQEPEPAQSGGFCPVFGDKKCN